MSAYITATKLSIEDFNKAYNDYDNFVDDKYFIVVGEDGKEYKLKRKSLRYKVFIKNTECVSCGIKGEHYLLQRSIHQETELYHANLYGINSDGQQVLMTKDHIKRVREGGKDNLDNLQTMCCICNNVIKN